MTPKLMFIAAAPAVLAGAVHVIGRISAARYRRRVTRSLYPTPSDPHVTVATDKRVFVIGDVHGCVDEFRRLLQVAEVDLKETDVVLVGDVVNKGPDSMGCVRLAQEIGAVSVRGNHEDAALRHAREYHVDGRSPPKKYCWVEHITPECAEWMQRLPYTISLPRQNAIVVHAGLVPSLPLQRQERKTMVTARNLVESGDSEPAVAVSKTERGAPIGSCWPGPSLVVYGHDAKRGLQRYPHAVGLDTGCVYGKKLSGIYLDDPANVIQVAAARQYSVPSG